MLLAQCALADKAAFRRLYDENGSFLYAVALRITRDGALASDAVHDAMLQVWRNSSRFDPARGNAKGLAGEPRALSGARLRSGAREREVRGMPRWRSRWTLTRLPLERLLRPHGMGEALHRCLQAGRSFGRRSLVVLAFVEGSDAFRGGGAGAPAARDREVQHPPGACLALAGVSGRGGGVSAPDANGPADEQDLQAAEYVLGALPPHQARALEALAMSDAALADRIAAWERRLAPLADLVVPSPPPPLLWQRLALATGIDSVIQPMVADRDLVGRGMAGRDWQGGEWQGGDRLGGRCSRGVGGWAGGSWRRQG